jgi:hypothetical protein
MRLMNGAKQCCVNSCGAAGRHWLRQVTKRPLSGSANWLALQLLEPAMEHRTSAIRKPSNKGKLVGQKAPFKLKEIWAIRIRLQLANRRRELALFNLAIDSKLRARDLVKLRVRDVCHGGRHAIPGDGAAAKDSATGAVRDPGADP